MKNKNLIILPGNSNNNIEWLKEIQEFYQKDYHAFPLYYDYWHDNSEINIDKELSKLKKVINDIDDYYIVAKSIGSIISLLGIEKGIINPKKLILMGLPLKIIKDEFDIEKLLKIANNRSKILIIQQENDILGKYKDVKNILSAGINIIKIKGKDHAYDDYLEIKKIIDNFIK